MSAAYTPEKRLRAEIKHLRPGSRNVATVALDALLAENARLREALRVADVALNWNEPRIKPTKETPDQATANRQARAALAAVPEERG